jgi:hypothetical protein
MVGVLTEYWNYRGDLEKWRRLLCLPQREDGKAPGQWVRAQRRLSPEDVALLVAERRTGTEIQYLAEKFGVDRATVNNHLRRAGVERRKNTGRSLGAEQVRLAGELYETGVSLLKVGEHFNVDRRYLRRTLPAAGFRLRPPGRPARAARG